MNTESFMNFKFKMLNRSLEALGLNSTIFDIYSILVAILFLGNINCDDKNLTNKFQDCSELTKVSKLLSVIFIISFLILKRLINKF